MVSRNDALQSQLNVLVCPQRLLAASVNLLTIVLVVVGKTSEKEKEKLMLLSLTQLYRITEMSRLEKILRIIMFNL